MKRVYFVRHGETDGNMRKVYQSPDVPLSEKGLAGAKAVAERLATLPIDSIIASDFKRAQQTAAVIQLVTDRALATSSYIHEVMNAKYMWGVPIDGEVGLAYAQERKAGFLTPSWSPDGAENYFLVSARVNATIALLEAHADQHIAVVTHGNFVKFLTARLLLNKREDVESNMAVYRSLERMSNVGITEFVYHDRAWHLFTYNDHAHFAE